MEKILYTPEDLDGMVLEMCDDIVNSNDAVSDAAVKKKSPLVVCVLRAGFFVHADMMRFLFAKFSFDATPDWIRVSTYNKQSILKGISGSESTMMMDFKEHQQLSGRNVFL